MARKQLDKLKIRLSFFTFILMAINCTAQHDQLPLFQIADLQLLGAFRLPADEFGISSLNYSEGPIAFNPDRNSIYVVGHSHHQAIAEFPIPEIVLSDQIENLPISPSPNQSFATILNRAANGNPQNMDRIGGLKYIENELSGSLLINTYEYYDAPGDNTHSTLLIRDANDLDSSAIDGYYSFAGGAGHTSGWISEVPSLWATFLGGNHITGQSSGIPIISRTSVGPSAFIFNPKDVLSQKSGIIPTIPLLDFSLEHPLHSDLDNASIANKLWTHLSRVTYGLIIPGTRSYLTIGYSGGHSSGVCYKCTQDNGNLCGGYCAHKSQDYSTYYWLWDLNDLIDVKNGVLQPHEVVPYDYGIFQTPYSIHSNEIGGGDYDQITNRLFLTLQKADRTQGTYANPPVILCYRFSQNTTSKKKQLSEEQQLSQPMLNLSPNPSVDFIDITLDPIFTNDKFTIYICGVEGSIKVSRNFEMNTSPQKTFRINIENLPAGLYFVMYQSSRVKQVKKVFLTH